MGPVAYKLQLPQGSKIHPALHISLLKEYKGPIPPPTTSNADLEFTHPTPPLAIVAECTHHTDSSLKYQVLIEWANTDRDQVTWEDWDVLEDLYTAQALEDKVLFHRGSNVATHEAHSTDQRIKSAPGWATDFVTNM